MLSPQTLPADDLSWSRQAKWLISFSICFRHQWDQIEKGLRNKSHTQPHGKICSQGGKDTKFTVCNILLTGCSAKTGQQSLEEGDEGPDGNQHRGLERGPSTWPALTHQLPHTGSLSNWIVFKACLIKEKDFQSPSLELERWLSG